MNVVRVPTGTFWMERIGRPTEKNPQGNVERVPMSWRLVDDGGEGRPGVILGGASHGSLFALLLTKNQLVRAIEEIETVEDRLRGEQNARYG